VDFDLKSIQEGIRTKHWGATNMMKTRLLATISILAAALPSAALRAEPIGHVTGLGGVFVTSKDPKALAAWYKDVLGINLESWGGAILRYDAQGHPPMALWNAMPANSDEIAPSHREFMINFAVDNLDAFVARLKTKGVTILKREEDQTGKFATILDPDGTKIEFWQPPVK
jgi:catechol 2,3-dioxygenase-like lactoylglutathione lyase family enzyme